MKLENIKLSKGAHTTAEEGMCIMEAVAFFAKEPHSDRPACACPVLTEYMINLNDGMEDEERKLLLPYIEKLINTRDGKSHARMKILVKHAIVKTASYTLRLAGLEEQAVSLEAFDKENIDFDDAANAANAANAAAYAADAAFDADAYAAAAAYAYAADAYAAAADAYAAFAAYAAAAYAADAAAADAAAYAAYAARAAAYANKNHRAKFWEIALKALDEALAV